MTLTQYQVDAFAAALFKGNPAAVVPLQQWIDEKIMQQIAMENNLAETVFFVPSSEPGIDYEIRWFTPTVEINLCGHATLAAAHILFSVLGFSKPNLVFSSKSGLLKVWQEADRITLDFPSWAPSPVTDIPEGLQQVIQPVPYQQVFRYRDWLVEFANEAAVQDFIPDFSLMKRNGIDKLIITARGTEVDFVSRFFAPGVGVDEDPVTGSAHSQLIPYWSRQLNKSILTARQLSARGGELHCTQVNDERVTMSGRAVLFMKGEIYV